MEIYTEQPKHIIVDETGKYNLLQTARWMKFLAVIGMVMMGLLILFILFFSTVMATYLAASSGVPAATTAATTGVMVFMGAVSIGIYVYPIYATYQFAVVMKQAVAMANQQQFNRALRHLKGLFTYMGILTLIVIIIYALVFTLMIIGMTAMGGH